MDDECTCDPWHAVAVSCSRCERIEREHEQRESLRLLAALVDAFNILLVVQLRERQADFLSLRSEREPDVIRGHLLRAMREAYGLSLADGAQEIGCSVVRLSELERSYATARDDEWERIIGALLAAWKTRVRAHGG